MASIKSFTDVNQSKKLAKILPLESADMYHFIDDIDKVNNVGFGYRKITADYYSKTKLEYIPCWSLAALFGVLPTIDDGFEPQLHRSLDKYRCTYEGKEDSSGLWRVADNPVDACYEIILKLHELNLL